MKRPVFFFSFLLAGWLALAGEPVRFVQLTDTHFGPAAHLARGREAVAAINALPVRIDFVVVTGDIMHDNITDPKAVRRALAVMGALKVPVHYVPGNHDLSGRDAAQSVSVFTNRFGPLVSSAEYGGTEFVFVCTEPLAGGAQVEGYDPLGELERVLRNAAGRPAVIFHHRPSADNFYKNRLRAGWGRSEEGRRWRGLLESYPVRAVVAGHFHGDQLRWVGEVPLYVGAPLAGWWGRQASFRIYEYRDGKIGYRTVYCE